MMIITSKKLTPNTNNQKRLFLHHLHHPNNIIKSQQQTLTLSSSSSSSSSSSILHNIDQDQVIVEEEERVEQMFEKPLTPSDVGKLNRLVIPKQHAEKYFPLDRVDSAETTALLSFEDESGKSWKFRYSYWNSSQSYVLTKGWSRFVKENRLHAGDVVSFQRRPLWLRRRLHHRDDHEDLGRRFFIRWRRGGSPTPIHDHDNPHNPMLIITTSLVNNNTTPAAAAPPTYLRHQPPLHDQYHHHNHQYTTHHAGEPVVRRQPRGRWKRLRLFGVNLDCHQLDDEADCEGSSPFGSSFSDQGQTHLVYSQAHGSSTSHV